MRRSTPVLTTLAIAGATYALRAARRRRHPFWFRGRTALITGGSRGLGLVLARQLAAAGANVAICARDPDEVERARRDLSARGAAVFGRSCDITDPAQVATLLTDTEATLGPVDILINNAGVIQVGPFDAMTLSDFDESMRTHFWGPLHLTLAALPGMRARGGGRIVNIASIGGKISVPHLLPYCTGKFALVALSEGLRAALAREGIVVTTVCPGLMRTGSPRNVTVKGDHRAEYAWFAIADSLPVGSMSAARAARRILDACRFGQAEVYLSLPARAAATLHGIAPGLTTDVLGLVDRALPRTTAGGRRGRSGVESQSVLAPSPLTVLSDRAARRNNEIRTREGPS